jgi:hypothetical protein
MHRTCKRCKRQNSQAAFAFTAAHFRRMPSAAILESRDYLHVAVGATNSWSADDVSGHLCGREWDAIKFLCVNDLPEVERSLPDARLWIEKAITRTGAA